jgi:hypothetical protein
MTNDNDRHPRPLADGVSLIRRNPPRPREPVRRGVGAYRMGESLSPHAKR